MTLEWTAPLFMGVLCLACLAMAPKQKLAGKRRVFVVIGGWFLVVVGAAELLWQILTQLALRR